jgi:hypothetical protein
MRLGGSNSGLVSGTDFAKKRRMRRDCRRLLAGALLCGLILLLSRQAFGTVVAATLKLTDVQNAVNSALAGETVQIPAGVATWTAGLSINKAITLQGAGLGLTIIKDGITSGNSPLIAINLVSGKNIRITGIEFQDTAGSALQSNGVITVSGSDSDGSSVRFDHCRLNQLNGVAIETYNTIGVIDHNTFDPGYGTFIAVNNPNWRGVGSYGDNSYAQASGFGGSQFLFIEDNTFNGTGTQQSVDSYYGARFVFRYNTEVGCEPGGHGTDSTGRARGIRAMEMYNNSVSGSLPGNYFAVMRSGVVIAHDNTYSGSTQPIIKLSCYRQFNGFSPWGDSDGTNAWDKNQAGAPFYSGTVSSAGSLTVTVSGTPWTTNQWIGYCIKKTAGSGSGQQFAEILSNTNNTITFSSNGGYAGGPLSFNNGDNFKITKVTQGLDQPGVSGGSLLSGATPAVPGGWNNQVVEPCYQWNNTYNGGNMIFVATEPTIIANTHYYDNTPMPGYTPYTYPHPLVSGAVSTPTNLRVVQ